jgi:hypothetical protein
MLHEATKFAKIFPLDVTLWRKKRPVIGLPISTHRSLIRNRPSLKCMGEGFFLLGELPFDKFFGHIDSRLHITPRHRQRLVFPPFNLAHPTLEDDPDFKLENHVQRRQLSEGVNEASAVAEIVRYSNSRLLDRSRPLWCMTLFEARTFVCPLRDASLFG